MILTDEDIAKTLRPLILEYRRDPDGVMKAILKFIAQIREADIEHIIGETELRTNTEYTMDEVIKITIRDALRSEQRIRAGIKKDVADEG